MLNFIMHESRSTTHRRLNITLPEETAQMIDRVAKRGDRSRFIAEAVRHFVEEIGRKNLRRRLKEGALRRAERDLRLTEEWFAFEEESWRGIRR